MEAIDTAQEAEAAAEEEAEEEAASPEELGVKKKSNFGGLRSKVLQGNYERAEKLIEKAETVEKDLTLTLTLTLTLIKGGDGGERCLGSTEGRRRPAVSG